MLPGVLLPLDPPVELDRATAQRQALAELSGPAYQQARPGWVSRAVQWFLDWLSGLANQAAEAAPGGFWGLLGIVTMIVLTVAVVRWRLGPVSRGASLEFTVDPSVSSGQYRQRAELFAAAGNWDEAITQRMRAIARGCEERGIIASRPGRTADELAREVAQVMPSTGGELVAAVNLFDRVRYGNRPGDATGYRQVRTADEMVAATVPSDAKSDQPALPASTPVL